MRKIISELFRNITYKYYELDNFIYSFLQDINSPYKNYLYDIDLLTNPDNTILEIKNTINEYMGYEIESFSNIKILLLIIGIVINISNSKNICYNIKSEE